MWQPQPAVRPGELLPCGSNPSGTHREFFANPADIPDLLANGVTVREHGTTLRFHCSLSPTPYYANGDVQVVLVEEGW